MGTASECCGSLGSHRGTTSCAPVLRRSLGGARTAQNVLQAAIAFVTHLFEQRRARTTPRNRCCPRSRTDGRIGGGSSMVACIGSTDRREPLDDQRMLARREEVGVRGDRVCNELGAEEGRTIVRNSARPVIRTPCSSPPGSPERGGLADCPDADSPPRPAQRASFARTYHRGGDCQAGTGAPGPASGGQAERRAHVERSDPAGRVAIETRERHGAMGPRKRPGVRGAAPSDRR